MTTTTAKNGSHTKTMSLCRIGYTWANTLSNIKHPDGKNYFKRTTGGKNFSREAPAHANPFPLSPPFLVS